LEKKKLLNILLFETFLILKITQRDIIKKCVFVFMYRARYIVGFQYILNFIDIFSKNNHIQNFMKIHAVGAELTHEDRTTDGQT
jgi:hypothetical protein